MAIVYLSYFGLIQWRKWSRQKSHLFCTICTLCSTLVTRQAFERVQTSKLLTEFIWKDKGKYRPSTWAQSTGSVFNIKVSQDVLILSLRQETEAFTSNEAFLWSPTERTSVTVLHICLFAQGRPFRLPFQRLCKEQAKRAMYLPKHHRVRMGKRCLFSLLCLLLVASVAGKHVNGPPWLSLWRRVVRGRVACAGCA